MPLAALLALAHLAVAAVWLGSMTYSLGAVQPKIARFFTDELRREDFLVTLAQGNRWRVVGLIAVLVLTGAAVTLITGSGAVRLGYGVATVLYLGAAGVFWYVSWRHWPARIFAVPEEVPAFRRRLTALAYTMLVLVGLAFLTALSVSIDVA